MEPTTNRSQICNIPYTYQGSDYYFCSMFGSSVYQCEVGSGILDECTLGIKFDIES